MSVEILREAAAKMRDRAEAATPGPWAYWQMEERLEVFVPNGTMDTETVLEFKDCVDCEECVRPSDADTTHIASWHPAVALAVAKGFEELADEWDADEDVHPGGFHWTVYTAMSNAARAFLGRES